MPIVKVLLCMRSLMSRDVLRQHTLMAHLLDALEQSRTLATMDGSSCDGRLGISYLKAN